MKPTYRTRMECRCCHKPLERVRGSHYVVCENPECLTFDLAFDPRSHVALCEEEKAIAEQGGQAKRDV